MFLHFGIIHLAMNMFTLFYIGSQLEPMLGKTRYIVAYICAGLMGSMASLMWHSGGSAISAGASGAVFGIAGVFLALLLTNLVPKAIRKSMLQSIGVFVAYNIFYGMRPNSGIDNAAHLGGLIGGMAIGFVYYFSLGERFSSSRRNMQVAAVSVVTVALMVLSLKGRYNQDALFRGKFQEFAVAEELAMKPLREQRYDESTLETVTLYQWQKADEIVKDMERYNLGERFAKTTVKLREYVDLRIKFTELMLEMVKSDTEEGGDELNKMAEEINRVIQELGEISSENQ